MNKQIKIMAILIAVMIVGMVYWVLTDVPPAPESAEPPSVPQSMSYSGNTLSEEKDGKKVWELTAELIEIDPVTKNTILKNIHGVFQQENGEIVTLTALQAVYDTQGKTMLITDKVQAIASNGAVLNADNLHWDSASAALTGTGNVQLTKEDIVITGDKLVSTDAFAKVKVSGNAHIVKGEK